MSREDLEKKFDEWWGAFPKESGWSKYSESKVAFFEIFNSKNEPDIGFEDLLDSTKRFAKTVAIRIVTADTDKQRMFHRDSVPAAARWLREKRWKDEQVQPMVESVSQSTSPKPTTPLYDHIAFNVIEAIKAAVDSLDLVEKHEKEIEELVHKINVGDFYIGARTFYEICELGVSLPQKYKGLLGKCIDEILLNGMEREANIRETIFEEKPSKTPDLTESKTSVDTGSAN